MNVWSLFKEIIQTQSSIFGQVSAVDITKGIATIQIPDISRSSGSITISDTSASINDYVIIRGGKIEQKFTISSLSYFESDV